MKNLRLSYPIAACFVAGTTLVNPASATAADAESLIRSKCLACHTEENAEPAQFSRMSHQRKTPEGWLMTIARMQVMHGLKVTDEERRTLVKYFADKQGLAPEETQGARYALERRLNTPESFESANFTEMCARCHSGARVLLQRRPAGEWEKLVHFHLGQWPSLEYQALARDRDWMDLAFKTMVPELAESLPLASEQWQQWQAQPKPDLLGRWAFAAHIQGQGPANGVMTITEAGKDQYAVALEGHYADGRSMKGAGMAVVYTGFEWRANLTVDGVAMRQVLAADKTAQQLKGRMFEAVHDEAGMDLQATKMGGQPQLLAVQPAFIRAGETQTLTLVGSGLGKEISLGDQVDILSETYRDDSKVVLQVKAKPNATTAQAAVKAGAAQGAALTVYNQIDQIKVVPAFAVARVGGNGGSTPKYNAQFEAEAWSHGADGQPNTEDDVRIGFMPAQWHVEPFDEQAKADQDVKFAGVMNAASGKFTTGAAGPNPERRMSTNNAGNLKVVAQLDAQGKTLSADGQLIVTVQRWNNPPLP